MPSVRPLETLHNALSLRQVDAFLEYVTATNFKTPCPSPPSMSGRSPLTKILKTSTRAPPLSHASRDSSTYFNTIILIFA
jgi:hypothetical protein